MPKKDLVKKFDLLARFYLFTYATHIPKEEIVAFIEGKVNAPVKIAVAHENGKSKEVPYEHTHLAVDFSRNLRRKVREDYFDFKGIHPNMKPCKGRTAFSDMILYMSKEDFRLFHSSMEVLDSSYIASLRTGTRQDLLEIMREATWRDSSAIRSALEVHDRLYERERPEAPAPWPLHDWQRLILYKILQDAPSRAIHWFYDPIGGAGKTEFAKWLVINYPNIGYVNSCGSARDFTTYLEGEIDPAAGRMMDLIMFDFTRANEERAIYDCIELVSNGIFNSLKFRGRLVILPKKIRVVVFANFAPHKRRMSMDRWVTYQITPGEGTMLVDQVNGSADVFRPIPLVRVTKEMRMRFEDVSDESETEDSNETNQSTDTVPAPPSAVAHPRVPNPWGDLQIGTPVPKDTGESDNETDVPCTSPEAWADRE